MMTGADFYGARLLEVESHRAARYVLKGKRKYMYNKKSAELELALGVLKVEISVT